MTTTYDAFVDAFHRYFTTDPNACLRLGVQKNLDRLPDPSVEALEAHASQGRALLAQLDDLERDGLDFDRDLDLDLARLHLESELHLKTCPMGDRGQLERMPTAGKDIGEGVFTLLIHDPRPAGERLSDITARLEQVPDYLEALQGRLTRPLQRWVAMDIQKVDGLPSLLDTIEAWAVEEQWADTERLRRARSQAQEAMAAYTQALAAREVSHDLHIGDAMTRRTVKLRGIDLSVEELHGIATRFLADTRAVIEELRQTLVGRYGLASDASVEELQVHLAQRYRSVKPGEPLERVLDRYRAEEASLQTFMDARQLFPIPDAQEMTILQTPEFMAPSIPAGAMMPPPAFRPGVARSLIYLTLSEELLDEHTELTIPAMMIHEGIPGHHLQLASAARHPSVIRRHLDSMDMAEGWTTMLEDYMLDVGYLGELTDEARFCGKRDISRLAARVAIDLFFMSGDRDLLDIGMPCDLSPKDPFKAAGNLLRAVTGFVPGRVEAELNWYSQERGYPLSYLTGNHLIWALKSEVAQASADKGLDLDRQFHRLYLESGNMPLTFLRRVFVHRGLLPS
ncbi:MAG: DUF885 family protein [Myxococcota bacterium]